MNNPQNIFSISILIIIGLLLSILLRFSFKIWNNLKPSINTTELKSNHPFEINDLKNKILVNSKIINNYNQTSAFQQTLMHNISEFKTDHNISIYSIPKVHISNSSNTKSTTIQIQIIGDFKNQLQLLQHFEKKLDQIPLKSCSYRIEKKKKKKKLIGIYIFQYKSFNSI